VPTLARSRAQNLRFEYKGRVTIGHGGKDDCR